MRAERAAARFLMTGALIENMILHGAFFVQPPPGAETRASSAPIEWLKSPVPKELLDAFVQAGLDLFEPPDFVAKMPLSLSP